MDNKKEAEKEFCIDEALTWVVRSFKYIVSLACAVFIIWYTVMLKNWLFALVVFGLVPLVVGLVVYEIFKAGFESGAIWLEEYEDDKGDE